MFLALVIVTFTIVAVIVWNVVKNIPTVMPV